MLHYHNKTFGSTDNVYVKRNFEIVLAEGGFEKLIRKAGQAGVSISEFLTLMIEDIINKTPPCNNGESLNCREDAAGFALKWHEIYRCNDTLLKYLLECNKDVDDFITAYDEYEYYVQNPKAYEEEENNLQEGDDLWFRREVFDVLDEWKHDEYDLDCEVENCRQWLQEYEEIIGKKEPGVDVYETA